jgi:hypothetical protein
MRISYFTLLLDVNIAVIRSLEIVLCFAMITLVASVAVAGTCNAGDDYATVCTVGHIADCGAPNGPPCSIGISGGPPTAYPDIVCVQPQTVLQWYEKDNNRFFKVIFADDHLFYDHKKSFTGKKVGGLNVMPSDTLALSAEGCYPFSIRQCTDAAMQDCTTTDPKVIVNGTHLKPPLKK